jgi:IS5 family transposase
MKQLTFAGASYAAKKKTTKRERFLAEMDKVVPWSDLQGLIEPYYPKSGPKGGRPPIGLAQMLRVWCLQQWFALSDPGMEEALYDIESMRRFAGFELLEDAIPDETTILNFRRLLERHQLTEKLFAHIRQWLEAKGLLLRSGTLVDATLIAAPPSTKNAEHKRDPQMTQTKKGNTWYFGMKAHIGVDKDSGLIHTVCTSTAKVADCAMTEALLHGQERSVYADRGYDYPHVHELIAAQGALDAVAIRRKPGIELTEPESLFNHLVAKVRSKVEHPFRVLKRQFGYTQVRYRGLAKNTSQIFGLFALVNLYLARRHLMPQGA